MRLLVADHMTERINIFHPGHGFPDLIRIDILRSGDEPITGKGRTVLEALADAEKQLGLPLCPLDEIANSETSDTAKKS